jgi:hypothetical protein
MADNIDTEAYEKLLSIVRLLVDKLDEARWLWVERARDKHLLGLPRRMLSTSK